MKTVKQILILPYKIINLFFEAKRMQRKYTPKHHMGK
jgi:hypothetical protein